MEDYRKELLEVKTELEVIDNEIQQLLQRKTDLQERKKDVEEILSRDVCKTEQKNEEWDKADFPWSDELHEKMKTVFRINMLRPMQLQAMNVTMSNKDSILIMPTGGGKSLCFQLPAILSKGVTLVVSPLVSLMEDQVNSLEGYAVEAAMLNASCDKQTLKTIQDAMIDKKSTLKLLYVTPEKLAKSKRFMARLEKMYHMGRFSHLVIDEVHCCSQWGHDFRPDYKFLGVMKRQFPDVSILGLTATATLKVVEDVKKMLNIPKCYLFRASFNRPNLLYEVKLKSSSQKETMDNIVMLINNRFKGQSGIVYCLTRKDSEDVTVQLQTRGINAGCYHADLSARERSKVHKDWLKNSTHVVVATLAFGMGIDKPDVRFVIHHSLSKSMENLYQESGRAGRDDQCSHCIVYYRLADVFRISTMVFAEQTGLQNLYGIMKYCTDTSRCRRSMIARYFGEVWDKSQCNKMCDHCISDKEGLEKKDVTKHCQNVLKILDLAESLEQRLTALKLTDIWMGKGASALRIKGMQAPSLAREKLEAIIAHMLLQNYLEESFHFTAYSTISYLVPGSKGQLLRAGIDKVTMEIPVKQVNNMSSVSSPSTTASSTTLTTSVKSKLCVINRQNSAFGTACSTVNQSDKDDIKSPKHHTKKKRKKMITLIDSDSDIEILDFGDSDISKPKKKAVSPIHT